MFLLPVFGTLFLCPGCNLVEPSSVITLMVWAPCVSLSRLQYSLLHLNDTGYPGVREEEGGKKCEGSKVTGSNEENSKGEIKVTGSRP